MKEVLSNLEIPLQERSVIKSTLQRNFGINDLGCFPSGWTHLQIYFMVLTNTPKAFIYSNSISFSHTAPILNFDS